MEKIQLIHPQGKKAVSMNKEKYETLKTSLILCLNIKRTASFQELLAEVTADLNKRELTIAGKIEWNLFWVTLDMESKKELFRNKSVSPMLYSLPQ